jgi:hypothetical protein
MLFFAFYLFLIHFIIGTSKKPFIILRCKNKTPVTYHVTEVYELLEVRISYFFSGAVETVSTLGSAGIVASSLE